MTVNVIKNGFKNKTTIGIAIILPLIAMTILTYLISTMGACEPVTIGVVNDDNGMGSLSASTAIINELKNQENVTVVSLGKTDDIKSEMDEKNIDGALVFNENFTSNLALKKSAEMNLSVEGTDQTKTLFMAKTVNNASTQAAVKLGSSGTSLKLNTDSVYGGSMSTTDLVMTNVLALITLILSIVLPTLSMLNFKVTDTFKKMSKYPLKAVVSLIIGFGTFTSLLRMIILSYAIYISKISFTGSIINTAVLMLVIGLVGTSLGVLVSVAAKTERATFGLIIPVIVLQYLFGGIVVPVSKFNAYVQMFSNILPMTYALDAMKSIAIRGYSLGDVRFDILALAIIFVIINLIAVLILKFGSNKMEVDLNEIESSVN